MPVPLLVAAGLAALEGLGTAAYAVAEALHISSSRAVMGVTTSLFLIIYGAGMLVCETVSTSLSSLGGTILEVLRLRNRSITNANARMEQATKGQIGQPAACMIENNIALRVV